MVNNQVIKRVGMLSAPLAFAALTLFHSHTSPSELGEGITRWMVVHSLQLVLSVLVAYCVWWILDGIRGAAAQTARAALPIFLVFFSATDAVAGLATGWLTHKQIPSPQLISRPPFERSTRSSTTTGSPAASRWQAPWEPPPGPLSPSRGRSPSAPQGQTGSRWH